MGSSAEGVCDSPGLEHPYTGYVHVSSSVFASLTYEGDAESVQPSQQLRISLRIASKHLLEDEGGQLLLWALGQLGGVLADDDPRKWRDDRGPSQCQWGRGAGSKRTKRRKK